MARTRSPATYPEKRAHLLEAAERLFLKHGYEGTSMSKLADEANVAPNTLYWYFADKDALLVEVLNSLLLRMVHKYGAHADEPFDAQLFWLTQVFIETRSLVATVHNRAALSPAVAQWHDRFHAFLEAQFVERMRRAGISAAKARSAARITTFVLEGMISHGCSVAERKDLIKTLIGRLES